LANTKTTKSYRPRNYTLTIVLFLLFFHCLKANDHFSSYNLTNWNSSNALPQNSCHGLSSDPKGDIWISTFGGIVKYDGRNFKSFNSNTTPEISVNRFIYIKVNSNNEVFALSTEGGMIYGYKNKFRFIPYKSPSDFPFGLELDKNGKPIILLSSGIYTVENLKLIEHPFLSKIPLPVHPLNIHYDKDSDSILIAHSLGVLVGNDKGYSSIEYYNDQYIRATYTKSDTLFVCAEKQTDVWVNNILVKSIPNISTQGSNPTLFSKFLGGAVIQGSGKTVRIIYPDLRIHTINTTDSDYNRINSILADKEGNIWLGTNENGLFKLTKNLFEVVDRNTGMTRENVQGIHQDGSKIWFGYNCGGIGYYDTKSKSVKEFRIAKNGRSYPGGGCATSFEKDIHGTIWFGSHGDGLNGIFKNGEQIQITDIHGLKGRTVLSILDNKKGYLILGLIEGIQLFNLETHQLENPFKGTPLNKASVHTIFIDRSERIWLGTDTGIFLIDNGTVQHLGMDEGLPHLNCRAFYQDETDAIWIGTYGGGLARYQNGKIQHISTKNGLWNNVVSTIVRHGDMLWFTCNEGLYGTSIADLRAYFDGKNSEVYCLNFGLNAGLKRNEFNGGIQSSGFEGPNGYLYFPSIGGLVIFNPNSLPVIPSPEIFVSDIIVDGKSKNLYEPLILLDKDKRVSFKISYPSYAYPQNSIRLYQLKGYDNEWKKLDVNSEIDFTNLSPGEYELKLKTFSLLDPNRNEMESSLTFKVETPWFLDVKVLAFLSLGVIGFLVLSIVLIQAEGRRRKENFQKALDNRTKELQESKQRLTTLIENTDMLIWSVDNTYKLQSYNWLFTEFMVDYFGFKPSLGLDLLAVTKTATQDFWLKHFGKVLSGESVKVEVKHLNKYEERIVMETNLFPITDELNQIIGIVGFSRDMTEAVQRENELKKARKEAEQAANVKSDFLATMSHEIRTPLNGVIGTTSLLLAEQLNDEQKDLVKTIRISSETLMKIINEILDFSKLESGKTSLEIVPFHLKHTLEETLSLVKNRANEKGLNLHLSTGTNVPEIVRGDVTRIRQVLLNLLSNAVKFTNDGEVKLEASIQEISGSHAVFHFSVSDTGIGIDNKKIKELFDPFNQLDQSTTRKFGGTGLGLSISKKLIELMNGKIWVNSIPNKGTTFHFTTKLEIVKSIPHLNNELPDRPDDLRVIGIISCAPNQLEKELEKDLIRWGCNVSIYDPSIDSSKLEKMDFLILCQPNEKIEQLKVPTIIVPEVQHEIQVSASLIIEKVKEQFSKAKKNKRAIKQARILVAEDNLVNQKIAMMLLEKLGHQADVVANGLEAIDSLTRQEYDLVLMDVQMPELDGIEATKRIRSEFTTNNQPTIIAVTANAMNGDKEKCLEAGMDDYLAKPVTLQSLEKSLSKWL